MSQKRIKISDALWFIQLSFAQSYWGLNQTRKKLKDDFVPRKKKGYILNIYKYKNKYNMYIDNI